MNISRSIRPKRLCPSAGKNCACSAAISRRRHRADHLLFGNAVLRFALLLHLLRENGSSALFGAAYGLLVRPDGRLLFPAQA